MHITSLTAYHVRLPLKRPFSHASHVRQESENVLIRCQLSDGTIGWGEGVPREYVTGETPKSCFEQLVATPLAEQLSGGFGSWPEVLDLCQRFEPTPLGRDPRGCMGNALRCSVELSILDAFGRACSQPVSTATQYFEKAEMIRANSSLVRYSTVIGSGSRVQLKALKMRLYGFRQCKVKVGAGEDDTKNLRLIRRWIGQKVDIRIDANEAWHADDLASKLQPLLEFNISSLEQPCPHEQLAKMASIRAILSVPIMLDESLTNKADAERAVQLGACDLLNIRLSKCGGFLASLRLAALAKQAELGFQLGCHPGESGILSAAGRHWACSVGGIRYLEGSYDRHLFHRLLTNEDITFGYGGVAPALTGPGLGVTVNENVLSDVTVGQQTFEVT